MRASVGFLEHYSGWCHRSKHTSSHRLVPHRSSTRNLRVWGITADEAHPSRIPLISAVTMCFEVRIHSGLVRSKGVRYLLSSGSQIFLIDHRLSFRSMRKWSVHRSFWRGLYLSDRSLWSRAWTRLSTREYLQWRYSFSFRTDHINCKTVSRPGRCMGTMTQIVTTTPVLLKMFLQSIFYLKMLTSQKGFSMLLEEKRAAGAKCSLFIQFCVIVHWMLMIFR